MRVYKSWQHHAAAPVNDIRLGIRVPHLVEAAAGGDAAGPNQQSAIGVRVESARVMKRIGGGVKDGGSKKLGAAHPNAARPARPRRPAKKIRSGVAGGAGTETRPGATR